MKKYKLKLKAQEFTFEDFNDFQNKIKNLLYHGVLIFETEVISNDTEDDTPDDIEKPKPDGDQEDKPPKTQLKAQKSGAEHGSGPKRKRGGKRFPKELVEFVKKRVDELNNSDLCDEINKEFDLNMVSQNLSKWMYSKGIKRIKRVRALKVKKPKSDGPDGEHVKEQGVPDKRTQSKYPKEIKEFIRSRMEKNSNQDLIDLINEKWDIGISMTQLKNYMKNYQLKRVKIIRTPRRKKTDIKKEKNLPGESVGDEVKRIEEQREGLEDDDDIDGLELDD